MPLKCMSQVFTRFTEFINFYPNTEGTHGRCDTKNKRCLTM